MVTSPRLSSEWSCFNLIENDPDDCRVRGLIKQGGGVLACGRRKMNPTSRRDFLKFGAALPLALHSLDLRKDMPKRATPPKTRHVHLQFTRNLSP